MAVVVRRRGLRDGIPQRRWFAHTLANVRVVELNLMSSRLPGSRRSPGGTGAARRRPDRDEDVDVYFDNGPRRAAVDNAIAIGEPLERSGLQPTRTPGPGSWS